jgi:sucrose phosphorylase
MDLQIGLLNKIAAHWQKIYKENFSERHVNDVCRLIGNISPSGSNKISLWSEKDVVLIAYGDSIRSAGKMPLQALHTYLKDYVGEAVNCVHILPFFPYSSDDGFSVIDYLKVDEDLGDWADIRAISADFGIMTDLVVNHVSQHHMWFKNFLDDKMPGKGYFIEMGPDTDFSAVIRPRSTPLLTGFTSGGGIRHAWTTFSDDQVDLNFRNPEVLVEMIRVLLFYLKQGIRILRLDAIAFLWKKPGTSCLHLPETHEIVKLLRTIAAAVSPGVLILTETNVPHPENISYFGNGDEAHMVYQFSLPPLLLYTLFSGNSAYLVRWMETLSLPYPGCTFFNFTASHDGIGVRPLEGLLPAEKFRELLEKMQQFGGKIGLKRNADGSETPYEINITYFDALKETMAGTDDLQPVRFLCSQLIMLGMKGIPALYLNSMLALPNDYEGMTRTGMARSINRRKLEAQELDYILRNNKATRFVFHELIRILHIRKTCTAFHPDSIQEIIPSEHSFLAFRRYNRLSGEEIICISNVSDQSNEFTLEYKGNASGNYVDLLSDQIIDFREKKLTFRPYRTCWLRKSGLP